MQKVSNRASRSEFKGNEARGVIFVTSRSSTDRNPRRMRWATPALGWGVRTGIVGRPLNSVDGSGNVVFPWAFCAGLVWFAVEAAVILGANWAAGGEWPGEGDQHLRGDEGDPGTFCERMRRDEVIWQPVNTWSNLLFAVLGLNLLWALDVQRARGYWRRRGRWSCSGNELAAEDMDLQPNSDSADFTLRTLPIEYPLLYGFVTIYLCWGSFAFHASWRVWAGMLDNVSMTMFISFIMLRSPAAVFSWSWLRFLLVYVVANIALAVATVAFREIELGAILFAVMVGIAVITETFVVFGWLDRLLRWCLGPRAPGHVVKRNGKFLAAVFASFGIGAVVWQLSDTGAPLCDPDSAFQGHGVWHASCAVAAWLLWQYQLTEEIVLFEHLIDDGEVSLGLSSSSV
jgi:hypothetical protein